MGIYRSIGIAWLAVLATGPVTGCAWLQTEQLFTSEAELEYDDGVLERVTIFCQAGESVDQREVENPGL